MVLQGCCCCQRMCMSMMRLWRGVASGLAWEEETSAFVLRHLIHGLRQRRPGHTDF